MAIEVVGPLCFVGICEARRMGSSISSVAHVVIFKEFLFQSENLILMVAGFWLGFFQEKNSF